MDVTAWRRRMRGELIARRLDVPPETQRRADQRIAEFLEAGFPMLERLTIGFYWPFNAEVDPRTVVHRFRLRGARTALPVVVRKRAPLEFRSWSPGVETVPGVFGLPVPQSPAVVPDVLLMPPLGFDEAGYRLGYGGGYFDRTLAGLDPQPLKIGLARGVSRIETIHPQPHDIPMDFVITEEGIHAAGPQGLRLLDPAEVAPMPNPLPETEPGSPSRRRFLLAAGLGAAGAATVAGTQRLEPGSANRAASDELGGYRASPHVLKYYRTAT